MEFKPGDRVQLDATSDDPKDGVYVGCSPRREDLIVVDVVDEDGSYVGVYREWYRGRVTLTPDTVTVTVELRREEAEAALRFVTEEPWTADPDADISAPADSVAALDTRSCRRLRAAIREALQ